MYVESHYTGADDTYVDRMVAVDDKEDMRLEAAFMVGAGVNCGRTATDYSDPLQKGYPRTYSVEATETIVKGLYKIMNGPKEGFWVLGPEGARKLLAKMLLDRNSLASLHDELLVMDNNGDLTMPWQPEWTNSYDRHIDDRYKAMLPDGHKDKKELPGMLN